MNKFKIEFNTILKPALLKLGFAEIKLKNCIHSEFLFNKDRLWFAMSWDWRDRYLEVSLGHLFDFKDVMERVVVIGDYSNYDRRIKWDAIDKLGGEKVFEIIAASLKNAIDLYSQDYKKIFQDFRVSRSKGNRINIDEYIGKELKIEDLKKYRA